jgi:hypothetical protein
MMPEPAIFDSHFCAAIAYLILALIVAVFAALHGLRERWR